MRNLVNKVKHEEVGRATLSGLGKGQNFGPGAGKRDVTGVGKGTQAIGADSGTVFH